MRRDLTTGTGALIILVASLILFQPLLFPAVPERIYPWGSDTWGHLVKAVYLEQQISQGNYYPDLFPGWYNGIQLLRYHAPLPYYLLVFINQATNSIWWAGNVFLFLCSLGGGLGLLLYRRWLGWLPAVAAGVLFMMLPDNLRVAFAEGNLPRALATALLPVTFYFFLRLTMFNARRRDFIGVAAGLALIVLSHAMMAAIFALGCGLFALTSGLMGRTYFRSAGRGLAALAVGLMVSGWWLLPSVTGGINEIDQQAASDALAQFPLSISLNPALRASDQEIYYLGLTLVLGLGLALVFWKRLDHWLRALVITALVTVLISSTVANGLYNALPFHQLFWPIRFLSFAGFAMLLVVAGLASWLWRQQSASRVNFCQLGALVLVIVLLADFNPSARLVRGHQQPQDLVEFSQRINQLEGWRVATADLSRLGSGPSYLFTYPGGREQVFGWAVQGSAIAPLLARINQAMVQGFDSYALDRLSLAGTDDVVVLKQPEIPSAFTRALQENGFELDRTSTRLELYHRDGQPRAYTIPYRVLGIGLGADNLALIFPTVVVGGSVYLDDYDPEFLGRFDQIFLSGFKWHSREAAEQRVLDYLDQGGQRVVVDLTGVPNEIMSRQPKFLEVYGEPVLAIDQADLRDGGRVTRLRPFHEGYQPWVTHTPQGVDEVPVIFSYRVTNGTALGVKNTPNGPVHFIGLNLVFHALLTDDPAAVGLLEDLFHLEAGQLPVRQIIPLEHYVAGEAGYRFSYQVDQETQVLIPIAHHAGTRVYIDGESVPSQSVDQFTLTNFNAGTHQVEVRSELVPIYYLGRAVSVLGLLFVAIYCVGLARRWDLRRLWPKRGRSTYAAGR